MPETNLFEIQVLDEDNTVLAEPTPWLKSLPTASQVRKLRHYLTDLKGEYDMEADATEQVRISKIMAAARHYLDELQH